MITNFRKNAELTNYRQTNFLDFGHTIGTTVGYIVSDNFNIESTININSTSGYKRAYYAEGISYIENLDLNYSSISILAKKMNNKSNVILICVAIVAILLGYTYLTVGPDILRATADLLDTVWQAIKCLFGIAVVCVIFWGLWKTGLFK